MKTYKLQELCRIEKGKQIDTTKLNSQSQYKYINGGIKESGYYHEYNTDGETVIVSEGGACGYTNYLNEKFWCGCHCYKLTDCIVMPKYLYYTLKGNQDSIRALRSGATISNIKKKDFENFSLKIDTNTKRQKLIVYILDGISKAINDKTKQLAELDELVKSHFIALFGDAVENNKGYECSLLKNLTYKIGSGATPNGGKSNYPLTGISFIRSMNVYDGCFEYKDLAHINNAQAEKLNGVTVKTGDVLFNITGASIARTCVVPNEILPARVNQHVAIIRPTEKLNSIFVSYLLSSQPMKNKLIGIGEAAGATRQAITKGDLEKLLVIVPPLELQNKFAAFVKKVDEAKSIVKAQIQNLQELLDSKMNEYFG